MADKSLKFSESGVTPAFVDHPEFTETCNERLRQHCPIRQLGGGSCVSFGGSVLVNIRHSFLLQFWLILISLDNESIGNLIIIIELVYVVFVMQLFI